jgi:hypothetical protein
MPHRKKWLNAVAQYYAVYQQQLDPTKAPKLVALIPVPHLAKGVADGVLYRLRELYKLQSPTYATYVTLRTY